MSNEETLNRHDFIILFDVQDGNPNGDPDAGNQPRMDPETSQGIVTDVCIKRKIRNYIQDVKELKSSYDIYIKNSAVLGLLNGAAYDSLQIEKKGKDQPKNDVENARVKMCQDYYDVRAFGAVMTINSVANCGQVRGPIQLTFGRSVDPVFPINHSITRCAVATEKEADAQNGGNHTFGSKWTIPYGLFVMKGFFSPALAKKTGFSADDLELFWTAIMNMFENDRSASRGFMATRKLIIFKHSSQWGECPSQELFNRVKIRRIGKDSARSFMDYEVAVNKENLEGVEVIEKM
jgi:CRISPR-associated protein Csd2